MLYHPQPTHESRAVSMATSFSSISFKNLANSKNVIKSRCFTFYLRKIESTRGVYLSALCHSSSGHLLRYIKGFALISMPLHPSHGACLCVHPYGLKRLRVCIHMLERVRCISARASASLLPFTDFFELRRALARVRGPPPVPVRTYGTCLVRNYTGALRFPVECLWEGG